MKIEAAKTGMTNSFHLYVETQAPAEVLWPLKKGGPPELLCISSQSETATCIRNHSSCSREFIQISAAQNKAALGTLACGPLNPMRLDTRFPVAEDITGPSVARWDSSPVQVGDKLEMGSNESC